MDNLFQSFKQSIKHWYIPLIIGILLALLGIYVFTIPLETYLTLALLFSVSFIVAGIMDIVFSIQNHKILKGWGWYLISGILTLAMGIYLVIYPGISVIILPFVVGFTLLFRSFLLLGYSFDLRDSKILSWGNVALLSVAGIIFSIMMLSSPFFTSISLVTLTAMTYIFVGVSSIFFSFELKKAKDMPRKISSELKEKMNALQKEVEQNLSKE